MKRIVIALFVSLAAAAAPQPAMKVWAIGDCYRVDPLAGKIYEANTLLFPDAPSRDLKVRNMAWDSASHTISLKAARNEIVAFQLIVERTGEEPLKDVNVKVGEWTGPSGQHLPKDAVSLFKEWYVDVRRQSSQQYSLGTGWYPDALIPTSNYHGRLFPASYILPFTIPDFLNNIGPKQRNQGLWADVYVPRDRAAAPPGTYRAPLTVTSDAGSVELTLELEIWDFALPDENHLAGNIHNDTELNTLNPELELRYYQMMRKHRLAMGVLGYAPDTKVQGTEVKFDWRSYDDRLGKYLDGSAFTAKYGYHGPGEGIPIELTVLPFDAYPTNDYYDSRNPGWPYGKEWKFYRPWPVDVPKGGVTPEYGEIWKSAFRGFQKHFEEKAWNRTKPIVFLLSLDESYDEPSVEKIYYYGKLLKDSGATRLKYRIDGSYPMDTMDRLAKVVDIVILGVRSYVPERVQQLRKYGVEDWFYTGMGQTDADPLGCRALGWVSWKYHAASWTIWEFDFNSLRAWQYPETYWERNGEVFNGMAMFLYRGEAMGLDEPVASIRLKLLRRGSQDYEYFRLLAKKPGGEALAESLTNSVLYQTLGTRGAWGSPGMWKHDAEQWERIRQRMGERIQ